MSKDVDMEGNFNVVSLMRHWMEKGDQRRAMILVALFSESMPQLEEHYKALKPQNFFNMKGMSISADSWDQPDDYFDKEKARTGLAAHLYEVYYEEVCGSDLCPVFYGEPGLLDWLFEQSFESLHVLFEEVSHSSTLREAEKCFSLSEFQTFLKGEVFFKR